MMTMIAPQVGAALGKVLVEIGKALGKAVIAGVGLELARSASGHVKQTLGPKEKPAPKKADAEDVVDDEGIDGVSSAADDNNDDELARVRRENARLKTELERLKRERQTATSR